MGRKERFYGKRSKKHQGTRCLTKLRSSFKLSVRISAAKYLCFFNVLYGSFILLCAHAVQSSKHERWDMSKSLVKELWDLGDTGHICKVTKWRGRKLKHFNFMLMTTKSMLLPAVDTCLWSRRSLL